MWSAIIFSCFLKNTKDNMDKKITVSKLITINDKSLIVLWKKIHLTDSAIVEKGFNEINVNFNPVKLDNEYKTGDKKIPNWRT